MKYLTGKSITDVKGIIASGISGGLKRSGKKDLCVIYSKGSPVSSAVFTKNVAKAAPVLLNIEHVKNSITKAIVVNSGNANSCTGKTGMKNAVAMAEAAAEELGVKKEEVLIQSTGIIGVQLEMDKIVSAIKKGCSVLSDDGGSDAAIAIKTTDTTKKEVAVSINIEGKEVTIAGMAKGSGMIHPNMATMLSFVMTDLNISKEMLEIAFKDVADTTFNMISVDGDTSTNDMAMVLANGLAGNDKIEAIGDDFFKFKEALMYINKELARLIAKDGEGASKLIEVEVNNAKDLDGARKCAKAIVTSSLTKCAFFGEDANWGRIFCAVGNSSEEINPEKVDISFVGKDGNLYVAKGGMGVSFDEEEAKKILEEDEIKVNVELNDGTFSATAWGCDLSYDYVKINGDYRT